MIPFSPLSKPNFKWFRVLYINALFGPQNIEIILNFSFIIPNNSKDLLYIFIDNFVTTAINDKFKLNLAK